MQALILCGGKGTRAYPHTVEIPKPLLDIAGRPVLGHLLDIFVHQGFTEFVLAAGYKADLVRRFAAGLPAELSVEVVDTGADANTGERVVACRDRLGERFLLTYADGLGNVDLNKLVSFHASHPGSATVTTVPLPSPYATFHVADDGRVEEFREKPQLADHLINAGFFVMDARVFDSWVGSDLEREILPALGLAGELYAFRHEGFWKSMDTYKDSMELAGFCGDGLPPWLSGDHIVSRPINDVARSSPRPSA